jgi:hypothetical protein
LEKAMAKEKFDRSKPHVNVGAATGIFENSSGQLVVTGSGSETQGNPAPSTLLGMNAPASSTLQRAMIAYPIDTDFLFDPATNGAAVSIDFQLDILPSVVDGTSQLYVTLALLQDEPFTAVLSRQSVAEGVSWLTLGDIGLQASDFSAVDGGPERPDFGRPFQFGYAFSGEYSTGGLDVQIGVDNMQVEITTIPEPSSIVLVLSLGVVLLWSRWWRRKLAPASCVGRIDADV